MGLKNSAGGNGSSSVNRFINSFTPTDTNRKKPINYDSG